MNVQTVASEIRAARPQRPDTVRAIRANGIERRHFLQVAGASLLAGAVSQAETMSAQLARPSAVPRDWEPRYLLASSLYGYTALPEVLDQVRLCGATAVDLWPKVHGNQREQLTEMGVDAFRTHLQQREIGLGCLTQFPLGPFGLADELRLAQSLDCRLIVTSCPGVKGQQGEALRRAVREFLQRMEPHLALAAETGVVIAIENHSNSLIDSVEALLTLHELNSSPHLGIAFAPYHLPQDVGILSDCLRDLGAAVKLFYAWQHGKGCMQPQPKADELLQLPGRGDLDFRPLMTVLRDNHYEGWIEIFMHPFPRGIPIHESVAEVTAEINRARDYLDHCLD